MESNNIIGSPKVAAREVVFDTPWFALVGKTVSENETTPPGKPHYSIQTSDYLCVIALTSSRQVIMVRQYRPAVEEFTLEFPAGHVDPGEEPEEAARRELLEETGYSGGNWQFLGRLIPDSGRLANRMWCFLAEQVEFEANHVPETGVESMLYSEKELWQFVQQGHFPHALHLAALLLAVEKGFVGLRH